MILWVWSSYRTGTGSPREAHKRQTDRHALSRFFDRVDLLFYAAVAAFAASLGALVLG